MMGQSNARGGLIVVRRVKAREGDREPFPGISPSEVWSRYAGIDGGHLWPGEAEGISISATTNLAPVEQLEKIRAYAQAVAGRERCDVLFVERMAPGAQDVATAKFLGYDVGVLNFDFGVYSLLFHEVIHPRLPELQDLARTLNARLLLPSLEVVARVKATRDALERRGVRFESVKSWDTFAVFEP